MKTRRPRARRIAGAVLLVAGAALLVATVFARSADRAVGERAVRIAGDASGAPDPGVPHGGGAFAFAVVGPVLGDDAALARALDLVPDGAPVVLLGDVLGDRPESDARRIAAVVDGRKDVVAVPGARDRAALDAFQSHVCAADWFFVHHDHLFVGGTPDPLPTRERAGVFRFGTDADDAFRLADTDELAVAIVHVGEDGEQTRDDLTVAYGTSAGALVRRLQLGVLGPATRSTGGFAALLALSAALLFAGERLAFPRTTGR